MASAFLLLLVLGCIVYGIFLRSKARRLPLPPGPNLSTSAQLPKIYPWKTYAEWRRSYGDLIYIYIFGNPILILNSSKVANDLLEKRSGIYSSRPQRTMVSKLIGFHWLFSTVSYGSWWKKHRALFHQYFNVGNTSTYHPIQARETHVMLKNLMETPDKFSHHVRRTEAAIVLKIIYDHQVAPEGDAYVTLADQALGTLAHSGLFGTYLVDYIPFLRHVPSWMPGASFKRKAAEWRKLTEAMLDKPVEMVKQRMKSGAIAPCFTAIELEKCWRTDNSPDQERLIKGVAATTYAAGADTTVSAILSFFLVACVYPETLKKAQAQIDQVVGHDGLPSFDDRSSLPYIDWMVWECLRWNPVTPLGLAHSVTEHDVYEGFHIPKGTTVLPNVWAMLHDETTYPDPFNFVPERYADEKRNAELGINEIPWAAFGFGRRACPGKYLAIDSVWIAVATLAAVFDISKAVDEKGTIIEPETEYTSTLLSRPKPFKCRIVPRSKAAASLIERSV